MATWRTAKCQLLLQPNDIVVVICSIRPTKSRQSDCSVQWASHNGRCNLCWIANCCISKAKLSLLTADGIVLQMVVFFLVLHVLRYFSNALLSCVCALVSNQGTRLSAWVAELITLEWSLPWMDQYVCLEVASMFEEGVTLCATETLFPGVCQYVAPEVTSCFARVVTLCAAEKIFTWVNPKVCFEVTSWSAREVTSCAVQWEGFSPEWVSKWMLRLPACKQ